MKSDRTIKYFLKSYIWEKQFLVEALEEDS